MEVGVFLKAYEMRLTELTSSPPRTLIIPVYQRNYSWKPDNCKQLFYDVEEIARTGNPHFIGTIVSQEIMGNVGTYREFVIIDGQQRITSVILFVKALYDLSDDINLKKSMQSAFLKNEEENTIKHRLRLMPIKYDYEIFNKLISNEFNENIFSDEEKSTTVYKNYLLFKEEIINSAFNVQQLYYAICKLEIVGIALTTENPQIIFESLNSTGLDLTNTDLLRNYLLMPLDYNTQTLLYNNYWLEIEKAIHPDNVEMFVLQYLIVKRKSNAVMQNKKKAQLNTNNLYNVFKQYYPIKNGDKEAVEKSLKDMYHYAGFYKHFLFNENTVMSKLSDLDKKFYELTFLLDSTYAPIILMYLYEKFDKGEISEKLFINFVDALISLSFRAKVCKGRAISAQFAGNVIARLDRHQFKNDYSDMDIFWEAITSGKGSYEFKNDEDFKQALLTANLYKSIGKGCKYLLYFFEVHSGHAKELPDYNSDSSIEHIMPQTLSKDWETYLTSKNDRQMYDQFLNNLGNLALTNYNSNIQNALFSIKQKEYAKSNYQYTRELASPSYTDWTSVQIQLRANKLANLALKIWTLPEKYNKTIPSMGFIFTLDSDPDSFTGKKLEKVSFLDKEKNISAWKDFLIEVIVKQLYALDKDTFKKAAAKENVPSFSTLFANKEDKEKLRKPVKIDENYYIESNFSAKDCFRILKAIIENFDSISETNLKDETWFTLRNN